ncbi:MAG: hypothetical protein GY811_04620 [Myxococcales bacterium]|nr:hypothetical protein [Myxococcales bacterium]
MSSAHAQSRFTISPASPVFWGSVGSLIVSAMLLVAGGYLATSDATPLPLDIALLVIAVVEGSTAFFTLQSKRVAWAFSLSVNGSCSLVMLFSAPRIRDAADVSILVALVPCILFGLLVLLQSLRPEEF